MIRVNCMRAIGFITLIAALWASAAAAGQDAEITGVRYGAFDGYTRIVIETDRELDYRLFTLSEQGRRLVVDLPRTLWRGPAEEVNGNQLRAPGYEAIRQARFGHYTADTSRIVFDLDAPLRVERDFYLPPAAPGEDHRLVLDLAETNDGAFEENAGFPQIETAVAAEADLFESPSIRRIVVDAGHGGHDPGAVGATGKYEKDIVMAATLAFRDILKARGYDVVLTRETDVYLDHDDRVAIARERDADLFISVHADSIGRPEVRGASVYTLSDRGATRAKNKVKSSDWVLDVTLSSPEPLVSDILLDLSQRETKNQSAKFADVLIEHLEEAGPVVRNTHREANFYVLLAPDVPAVLLEMGFMSNRQDEANLATPAYRERLMTSVADAIDAYFAQRERLFAAR